MQQLLALPFLLLWLAVAVLAVLTLGRHRAVSLRALAGALLMLLAAGTHTLSGFLTGMLSEGGGDLALTTVLLTSASLGGTVLRLGGVALLTWAAWTGRQAWYEAELPPP